MKELKFLFVGACKDPSFKRLEQEYLTKIRRYVQAQVTLIKDSCQKDPTLKKKQETEAILKNVRPGDVLVLCDERGRALDSHAFAGRLNDWQVAAQRVVFVVGGAYGFDDLATGRGGEGTTGRRDAQSQSRPPANLQGQFLLRLSDMTLPHELARVVLMEQVYRGLTILKGQRYHH